MARTLALPAPSDGSSSRKGTLGWIVTLGLLTILSAVIGGGFGFVMTSSIEKRVEAKYKVAPEKPAFVSPYAGDIAIKKMAPVVTNLAGPDNDWVRLESSIVYKAGPDQNPDVLAAQTRQDLLAYLRTLSLAQIQGPSGLLHVREDLNERAQLRSKGLIQEVVIETLVVQ